MIAVMRYLLLVLGIIISLHSILSYTSSDYSLANLRERFRNPLFVNPSPDSPTQDSSSYQNSTGGQRRAKAAFVFLARNRDLPGVIGSMRQAEDRFNKEYGYPWVFLNEEPFSDEFKSVTSTMTDSPTYYGLIPHDHWFQPDWIDEGKATRSRQAMVNKKVIYGGSVPYRNMCRYYSGFFFRHELLKDFDWYWRVDPDVNFYCDMHYDPFVYMEDNDKLYGFTLSIKEYPETIPTLWDTTKEFIRENPHLVAKDNAMGFLSNDDGESYNLCHFWSNFEIASLKLWRSEAYMKYFEFLDSTGGFYYERWGDAPVHSIAAGLFARPDQIHFFDDVGYFHAPFHHCPSTEKGRKDGRCWCDPKKSIDREWYSCTPKMLALQ